MVMKGWSTEDSARLYGVKAWGSECLSIDESGLLNVSINGHHAPIQHIISEAEKRGLGLPILLRFPDILKQQVHRIAGAFNQAIQASEYQGTYRGVFPIKVNQERCVVEDIIASATDHHMGLEAGSKPELLIVLAMLQDPDAIIVCNGYKDTEYIETALWAQRLGRRPFLVVEKPSELTQIIDVSSSLGIRPHIGIRARLSSKGTGRWQASSGDRAKFGLDAAQMLSAIDELDAAEMLDCLELLHFHIGSQISSIRSIKDAVKEAARIYVELRRLGAPMGFFDVGGGLGVDYDGSKTSLPDSINYTIDEYAADIVNGILRVIDDAGFKHPHIVTESGRAMVAHHAILVAEVLGVERVGTAGDPAMVAEDDPVPVKELAELLKHIDEDNVQRAWHDALTAREGVSTQFELGLLDLRQRAIGEELFWRIVSEIQETMETMNSPPEELSHLSELLADTYTTNFSIFQSTPDAWAIGQRFPIMPIQRLDEKPTRRGVIADLTCDSDGKINRFISGERTLQLHELDGQPYRLGFFLVGAYQEILGDLHNLFGDTHALHVRLNGNHFTIDSTETGDTVAEVLNYVHFDPSLLMAKVNQSADIAIKNGEMTPNGKSELLNFYKTALEGYTYFE